MAIRRAASKAFMEADCDDALRRAITSGPRSVQDFGVGELVYFYRMGAEHQLKFNLGYWHGPGRVVMVDLPSTIWVSHQGHLVKASPERLRRASPEEELTLSGWIDEVLNTRELVDGEPKKGYIDLSDEPLPPDEEPVERPLVRKRYLEKGPPVYVDELPAEDLRPSGPQADADLPASDSEPDPPTGAKREGELDGAEEPPTKRSRQEYLELYHARVENLTQARARKEIRLRELNNQNQACFIKAIEKEINNNLQIGAYKALSLEESARVRQQEATKIMESRFVLTAKPLEPQDVEDARKGQLLLEWTTGEPCKAKARHVMKGFSEEGAEHLEAATPQVTREGSLLVTQLVASHRWRLGFMDFTQAFHSGDPIERVIYAEQPRKGIPGMKPGQLLRLLKTCYGLSDGPFAWYKHLHKQLVDVLHYKQSLADPCIFYQHNKKGKLSGVIAVATDDLLHGGDGQHLANMEYLRTNYKLGKFQFDEGRFCGKTFLAPCQTEASR